MYIEGFKKKKPKNPYSFLKLKLAVLLHSPRIILPIPMFQL